MAGSLVLSGQPTASLSDKLTELDELQTEAKQVETKARKQAAKEEERKNERKRKRVNGESNQSSAKNTRSAKRDRRIERQAKRDINRGNADIRNSSGDTRVKNANNGQVLGTFESTFYTAYCSTGCTGVTATEVDVSNTIYHEGLRVIAVDPAVIPLGTRVKVTLADGSSFVASAEDTGGAIKGRRIDVLVASKAEARELGRQRAEIEVIE